MVITGFLLLGIYVITLLLFLLGYSKITYFNSSEDDAALSFSVVIPFRNETNNLLNLLKSISELNYPTSLFEVIFIDDASSDDSVARINNYSPKFNFKILKNKPLSKASKKDAITLGVKNAKFKWILTTDADCILPKRWLLTYNSFILKNNPYFVAGGVSYCSDSKFITSYQILDNCSLQTTTVAGFGLGTPFLCNGANLGFLKTVFSEVNGYAGNNHLASGDDIFLLEKIKNIYPTHVKYVKSKDCIVTTKPVSSWKSVIHQRVRWASKIPAQKNKGVIPLGILILGINIYMLVGFVCSLFNIIYLGYFLFFILIKAIIDGLYMYKSCVFLSQRITGINFISAFFVYPILSIVILGKSLTKNYKWKERTY